MSETRTLPRHFHLVTCLGLAVALASLVAQLTRDPDDREKRAWLARGPLEQAFRKDVARLERFRFQLDGLVLNAAPVQATTAEAAASPTIKTAIEGGVRADEAPPLVSAAVYQDFVLLATAHADGAPPLRKIPEDILWRELEHADETGGTTSLVWFSPDAESGVRLNLVGTAMHEDTAAQRARLRLLHVSMPFTPSVDAGIEVRCGIAEGEERHELPWVQVRRVANQGARGTTALRPADTPRLRWAVRSDEPRAQAFLARTPWWRNGASLAGLLFGAWLTVLVGLATSDHRRKRLATDPSPDEPSSPAGEDPSAPPSDA